MALPDGGRPSLEMGPDICVNRLLPSALNVAFWHFSEIEPARFNVRFRTLFGHQRLRTNETRYERSSPEVGSVPSTIASK
jgi:hypothetical protein